MTLDEGDIARHTKDLAILWNKLGVVVAGGTTDSSKPITRVIKKDGCWHNDGIRHESQNKSDMRGTIHLLWKYFLLPRKCPIAIWSGCCRWLFLDPPNVK